MTATTSPVAYSDSDTEYVEALEAARLNPAVYALVAHGLRPAPHHRQWLSAIRRCVETPGGRLLLIAPPGSAKSSYVSLMLPLWYLGRYPDRAVLAVTSSDPMAAQFDGTIALSLQTNEARRVVFPEPAVRPDVRRGWSSDGRYLVGTPQDVKDPSYRIAGLGSKVIGSRCHLLLLDDVADQEASTSVTEMRRIRGHLDLTLLSRLHPEGSAVAISTRWAEADVAAHLQDQGWEVVNTPALGDYPWLTPEQKNGEGVGSLWPHRWSLEWLLNERKRLGAAQWETVWQGNPISVGAGVFEAEWFRPLPTGFAAQLEPRLTRCTGIDLAWSSKETADYSAAVTIGYDPQDPQRRLYLLGFWRQRVDERGLVDALCEHLMAVQPHHVGVEVGAYRQAATEQLVDHLRQGLYGRLPHHPAVYGVAVTADKVTRARALAVHSEAGLVHADRQHPGWPLFEREALALPVGANDDLVDASSLATQLALTDSRRRDVQRPIRARFG